MKFKVTMKDPDTLHDAICDAVKEDLKSVQGINDEERDALHAVLCENVGQIAEKWFKYGEYLTVEIDTDAKTCVVVPT